MVARPIRPKSIKLPKRELNKVTNRVGTANITSHNTISNVSNPIIRLIFFCESENKAAI
jgi:hypothetical protein